jgi:hypothetical protein
MAAVPADQLPFAQRLHGTVDAITRVFGAAEIDDQWH